MEKRENHGSICGRDVDSGGKKEKGASSKNVGKSWEEMGKGKPG